MTSMGVFLLVEKASAESCNIELLLCFIIMLWKYYSYQQNISLLYSSDFYS